jgi:diguanylate cyclase (GGDEF)-like protein
MHRTVTYPEGFRRRFMLQVLMPLAIVLIVTYSTAGFLLFWATNSSNEVAAAQQKQFIHNTSEHSMHELELQLNSIVHWDNLKLHVYRQPLDIDWLDQNFAQWLYKMFKHQQVYLFDANNQPLYISEHGFHSNELKLQQQITDILPLLNALRQREQTAYLTKKTGVDINGEEGQVTHQITDLVLLSGRPAQVSVSVVGYPDTRNVAELPKPIMAVSIKFLSDLFLTRMLESTMFPELTLSDDNPHTSGRQSYLLTDSKQNPVSYLTWQASTPGSKLLQFVGPLTLTVFVVVLAILAFMVRSLWISAMKLSSSMLELRASEAHAKYLAFHDTLTGLPNRALFDDRIDQSLAHVARHGGYSALLALDLDRFKAVNDTLGHSAGDILIREVAERLSSLIRSTDTVARSGGDEFVLIQNDIVRIEDVEVLCRRIIQAVTQPFNIFGHEVYVGVSIGVGLAPIDSMDAAELMRKADIALYAAKNEGRGRFRYFNQSMDDVLQHRQDIAVELRAALQTGDGLRLFYQPEVDVSDQRILGLEALLRWEHPTRGLIMPDEFIPIAEETGLIVQLGEWVLNEACRAVQYWPDVFLAVNISPIQFNSADFVQRVIDIAAQNHCPPERIELEITENVLLRDDSNSRNILRALRCAGFRIALDDFGTGYSSLNYLTMFPIDKIKIDRSFTKNLGIVSNSEAIVESLVRLGRAMGLTVTAEGVETSGQMRALSDAGCHELQGYLFSRAVSSDGVDKLLQDKPLENKSSQSISLPIIL